MSISKNDWLNSDQAPRLRVADGRRAKSFGQLAGDFASQFGLTPDAWQDLVLEDWLAANGRDEWKHPIAGLSLSRQNGKNALLEMRELFGLVLLGENILHSAHEVKTAQAHYRRFKEFFGVKANDENARYPELNAMVEQVRNVNGQEAIILKNDPEKGWHGGSLRVIARSKSSGRGFTADLIVLDEAQELTEDALEALTSTGSAGHLGNSQVIYTGTVPGPNANGAIFARIRDQALSDHPGALCWHEWSPDPDAPVNLDDVELWKATNPGFVAGRIKKAFIELERQTLSDEGFARERLGMWPAHAGASRAIDPTTWTASTADAPADGIRSFAVAFSADGKRQALAGALKTGKGLDTKFHINVIDTFTGATDDGVSAVASWLAERKDRAAQINLVGGSGALALADALEARGVSKRIVHIMTTKEYFQSCSLLFEGLRDGRITHPEGDPEDALNSSVAVCDKKIRSRDGSWGWESSTPDGDDTPLEAASAAVLAAKTTKRRPGKKARAL